jgi:CheY-like chemotaxis protein/anti-sigma regulatory factor (Ser/Thr protein kinase)
MSTNREPRLVERRRPQLELDELLAILSHALRTPVQAISTNAWLIRSRSADESLTRPAEAIERQVARLSQVMDDLLDVARVSRKTDLAFAPVNVQAVVSAAVVAAQGTAASHRRELTVEMAKDALPLHADAQRLTQAIGNLLDNAVKYSPQQGVIVVAVTREGDEAVISVKDQGIGIAAEDLSGVFERFTRRIASSKEVEGYGLGLHMARELIEGHGGSIEAHSAGAGKGSEFVVRLPLAAEGRASAVAKDDAPDAQRLAILVVDDSRDAADSLAEVLTAQGHDARAAYGGQEALELVARGGFDVALVDIGMPTVDGLEVARQISHSPQGAHTLLVAVTGWGAPADRERSKAAGFAYHLTKPIDYDTLGALLATAARNRDAGLNPPK